MLRKNNAFDILYYEAAKQSAKYIKKYLYETIVSDRSLWIIAASKIEVKGLCLEFGVHTGKSINFLSKEKPKVNKNVILIKGFFKKTLPKFLKQHKDKVSLMHIDCDTYESTKEVLDIVSSKRLVPNTRILFDEYHSYIGWKNGGFKAWQKFVKKHKIKYKYEMFGERQALVKIC